MIAIMRGHDNVSLETSIWETGKKRNSWMRVPFPLFNSQVLSNLLVWVERLKAAEAPPNMLICA